MRAQEEGGSECSESGILNDYFSYKLNLLESVCCKVVKVEFLV